MNHWLETSKINLVPKSIADNFEEAVPEWFFTGAVFTYEDDEEVICELCEHGDLNNHFEIKNKENSNILLVGSSCILKFDRIEVRNKDGVLLYGYEERRSRLSEAVREKIREQMVIPLRTLWVLVKADKQLASDITVRAKALKEGKSLTPTDLLFIFKEMERHGIEYRPSLYKINIRTPFEKYALERMAKEDRNKLRGSFSAQQLKKYKYLFAAEGH